MGNGRARSSRPDRLAECSVPAQAGYKMKVLVLAEKHPGISTFVMCVVVVLGLLVYSLVVPEPPGRVYKGPLTGHVIQSTWFTPGQGRGWDGEGAEPSRFDIVLEDGSKWALGEGLLKWSEGNRVELGQSHRGYYVKNLDRYDEVENPDTRYADFMGHE
jgi:hypothetical protein